VVDHDFEVSILRSSDCKASFEAELRLLYVAVTRAKTVVQLPEAILKRFGLRITTNDIVGLDALSSTETPSPMDSPSCLESSRHIILLVLESLKK
jgi:ATP-dependent exoDNAse (exonuclease V) beta subunit